MTAPPRPWKIPESVLVLVHSPELDFLMLERSDWAGFWQSVTGSKDFAEESLVDACVREVQEETGIVARPDQVEDLHISQQYEIYQHWRHRYAPEINHNTEHQFALRVPRDTPVRTSPREHQRYQWLPWQQAAQLCISPSNAQAIRDYAQAQLKLRAETG